MHTQMLTWILLYMSAGVTLHALAALLYSGEFTAYNAFFLLLPLAICARLIFRLRQKYKMVALCPAEASTFSLGGLVFSILIIAILFAGISRGIDRSVIPAMAVWMLASAAAYVIGLVHASMRGHRDHIHRYAFAVLYALTVFGFCGIGIFSIALLFTAIFNPRGIPALIEILFNWSPSNDVVLPALRIQLLICLPFGILSLFVFEAFFPASEPLPFNQDIQSPEKPAGVWNLLSRIRDKRSEESE